MPSLDRVVRVDGEVAFWPPPRGRSRRGGQLLEHVVEEGQAVEAVAAPVPSTTRVPRWRLFVWRRARPLAERTHSWRLSSSVAPSTSRRARGTARSRSANRQSPADSPQALATTTVPDQHRALHQGLPHFSGVVRCRPEQQEVGVRGQTSTASSASAPRAAALFSDDRTLASISSTNVRQAAGLLGHRREVVRRATCMQAATTSGSATRSRGGRRPSTRSWRTYHDTSLPRPSVCSRSSRAEWGRTARRPRRPRPGPRLRPATSRSARAILPGRSDCSGSTRNEDRLGPLDELDGLRAIDGEVRTPPARDHRGPGDRAMCCGGRTSARRSRRPAGTAVGEQQALEPSFDRWRRRPPLHDVVQCCHARAQPRRLAVGSG